MTEALGWTTPSSRFLKTMLAYKSCQTLAVDFDFCGADYAEYVFALR